MKNFYLFTFILLLSFSSSAQVQLGNDIDGEKAEDNSGRSVSVSADGSVVAIAATHNDNGNGTNSGHVRIYKYQSDTWTQIGKDIDGEAAGDQSGNSISLSANGSIVAIGAVNNSGNGTNSGHVRIYQYQTDTWKQIGKDIDGEAVNDESGTSVSLSSDGSFVAVGAINSNGNGTNTGQVRIYHYLSDTWRQVGKDIDGEAIDDFSGSSVSLSADGKIVAISGIGNDDNGNRSGHVRVYQYQTDTWKQVGKDMDGEAVDDFSGFSVSLSADGSVVAIGAYVNDGNGTNSGHVRIYQYQTDTWKQVGNDIDGEAADDWSGFSVSLSSDGTIVAIGAFQNDGNGANSGHVRIYQNQSDAWNQVGKDIDGEAAGDESGISVSLSSDGNAVAIGANRNDGNGNRSGHVRVYKICDYYSILENPEDVTMSIGATAIMGLVSSYQSYQWQTDLGVGFQSLTNAGQYDGSDKDTLSIMQLTLSNNNQKFRCMVSTKYCSDTSNVAVLTVDASVGVIEINNEFSLYPNPTSKELRIKIDANLVGSNYTIADLLGQKVKQGKLTGLTSLIDVSKLSKGTYVLLIGDKTQSYQFLVK